MHNLINKVSHKKLTVSLIGIAHNMLWNVTFWKKKGFERIFREVNITNILFIR